jgi:HAD superfamily hydrolase (TIGR01549 family)
MSPRAIFFDMDDTLVDDTGCYQLSIEGVCADLGAPFDAVTLQAAYEASSLPWWPDGDLMSIRTKLWSQALEACGYDVGLAPRVVERYLHHRVQTATLLDGAIEVLEALRSKYRLAVITNGGGDIQRLRLAHLGLDKYFDAVVASTDVDAGKPDRRIFDHASRLLGVPAEETWHVGDSLASDVAGALNAGLQAAVWYNCAGAECGAEDAQPHFQIAALSELPALLR